MLQNALVTIHIYDLRLNKSSKTYIKRLSVDDALAVFDELLKPQNIHLLQAHLDTLTESLPHFRLSYPNWNNHHDLISRIW
jgi:hypothetical protein